MVASAIIALSGRRGADHGPGVIGAPVVIAYYGSFLVYLLAQIVAYVVTCAWLHLARRNAEVLNPTLPATTTPSAGSGVAGWFPS